ncbi:discoidin domain-containing protein [Streptomyces olivoreticuli]
MPETNIIPVAASTNMATSGGLAGEWSVGNMVDGDPNTCFLSGKAPQKEQWARIDLGTLQEINQVTLLFGDEPAPQSVLEYSTDSVSWTSLATINKGLKEFRYPIEWEESGKSVTSARYLRMRLTETLGAGDRVSVCVFSAGTSGPGTLNSGNVGNAALCNVSAELSTDVIVAEDVQSGGEPRMIAPFRAPKAEPGMAYDGAQALLVGRATRSLRAVQYVKRDPSAPAGWRLLYPFANSARNDNINEIAAVNVAAGGKNLVQAFMQNNTTSGNGLLYTYLEEGAGKAWSEPIQLLSSAGRPRIIHLPEGNNALYAIRKYTPANPQSADLYLTYLGTGGYVTDPYLYSLTLPPELINISDDDYCLIPGSPGFLILAATVGGKLITWSIWRRDSDSSPHFLPYTRSETGAENIVSLAGGFYSDVDSADETETVHILCHGKDSRVIDIPYVYDPAVEYEGGEFGVPYTIIGNQGGADKAIITSAGTQSDYDGGQIVFGVGRYDSESSSMNRLWVARRIMPAEGGRPPTPWSPAVPVDKNKSIIAPFPDRTSVTGENENAAFLSSDQGNDLWMYFYDYTAGDWQYSRVLATNDEMVTGKNGELISSGTPARETACYRVAATVTDTAGAPVPRHAVNLSVATGSPGCELTLQGKVYWVNQTPIVVQTDDHGRLTLAMRAVSLSAPKLEITVAGMSTRGIEAGSDINQYLAGRKNNLYPTNPGGPLPVFDGDGTVLRQHVPGDVSDSDVASAARSIIRTAQMGMNDSAGTGLYVNLEADAPEYKLLTSATEIIEAERTMYSRAGVNGLWDWFKKAASAVWQGIKTAAVKVADFVIEAGKAVVTVIADGARYVFEKVLSGIQEISDFIVNTLDKVKVAVEAAINWLKALFDFEAIRNTHRALVEAAESALTSAPVMIASGRTFLNEWFDSAQSQVNDAFVGLRREFGNKTINDTKPPASAPGQPSPGITTDVHANWAEDKLSVQSFPPNEDSLVTAGQVEALEGNVGAVKDKAGVAINALRDSFISGEGFGGLTLDKLLGAVQDVALAAIDVAKGAINDVIDLIVSILEKLKEVLTAEISLPSIVQKVWTWISGSEDAPTFLSMVCLIAAIPVTIAYKLAWGVSEQPFPDGHYLPRLGAGSLSNEHPHPKQPQLGIVAGFLRLSVLNIALSAADIAEWYSIGSGDPRTTWALLIPETILWFVDFMLVGAAEFEGSPPFDITLPGTVGFAYAYFAVLVTIIVRLFKRFTVGSRTGVGAGILTVFAAVNIGLNAVIWYFDANVDAAARSLYLAGILGALPDLFSLAPTVFQEPGLAVKIAVDVIAMLACGGATIYGYYQRSAPSLPSGRPAMPI